MKKPEKDKNQSYWTSKFKVMSQEAIFVQPVAQRHCKLNEPLQVERAIACSITLHAKQVADIVAESKIQIYFSLFRYDFSYKLQVSGVTAPCNMVCDGSCNSRQLARKIASCKITLKPFEDT